MLLVKHYFLIIHLWFVREEGLYISTNNEMNPNYDENQLVFKRVELNDVE